MRPLTLKYYCSARSIARHINLEYAEILGIVLGVLASSLMALWSDFRNLILNGGSLVSRVYWGVQVEYPSHLRLEGLQILADLRF